MSSSAEQRPWYRMTFPEENFAVVQAMAQEDIARDLRDDQEPQPSDVKILGMTAPFLRTRDIRDVGVLADRLDAFADRTDYVITDLAIEWPKELAEGLVAERMAQGDKAKDIARGLRSDLGWLAAMGDQPLDFDAWAEGLGPAT